MNPETNWKEAARKAQQALASQSQTNAELLERLSGIRVALAAVMRRSYPAHVSGVEKALGGHISDLPDSVLLGYLEAFSLMSASGKVTTPNDLQEISRALRDSGFPMEEDATAVDMAIAIRGGFQAAKYDNDRLRKNNRTKKGARSKGAEAIKRDLSWAEPQDDRPEKTAAVKETEQPKKQSPKERREFDQQSLFQNPAVEEQTTTPEPAEDIDEGKQRKFQELESHLLQPAPRFMRDVVNHLRDAELAAEWQEFQKGVGNWAFIPPQGKHRQRGALLIPREALTNSIADFSTSPWGRAVAEKYKAGRLYEIAIVLAKLSDTIVVCGFNKHVVELTYRHKGELRALIVGLEPGADPWLNLEDTVGNYSGDGTTSVQDILVVPCPAGSTDPVVDTLKAAKSAHSWRMTAPVRVQEMADWVTNDGRGATIIGSE